MQKLVIKGPAKLKGEVAISKSKNAYLPILAAVLLSDKKVTLKNLPELRDVETMIKLLQQLGVMVERRGNLTIFDASELTKYEATYELVRTMRASIFVLGPLIGRLKRAKVSLPGGCAIGTRPIDIHLENLKKMGVNINLQEGYVEAKCEELKNEKLVLSFPSVGATENLMMAAVFIEGKTIIENVAMEPEVSDLANFLNKMGAKITGIGTSKLEIIGVTELNSVEYEAIPDRIEASTYIMAALITNSHIRVKALNPIHIEYVLEKLIDMGAHLEIGVDYVDIFPSKLKGIKMETSPYPGFPTDVQAQMVALLVCVDGNSLVTENIFENRFMHIPELIRLGATITQLGSSIFIEGGNPLRAAPVMCTDLRASAALVLSALNAHGETKIDRIYHLERGYEKLCEKFEKLGVEIKIINE